MKVMIRLNQEVQKSLKCKACLMFGGRSNDEISIGTRTFKSEEEKQIAINLTLLLILFK